METKSKQIIPELRVTDASRLLYRSIATDPEREEQTRADVAALEVWLRAKGGQPWFEGIVLECIERFPRLDEFSVSRVIYKLRDEQSTRDAQEYAQCSISRFGVDLRFLSPERLKEIIQKTKNAARGVEAREK